MRILKEFIKLQIKTILEEQEKEKIEAGEEVQSPTSSQTSPEVSDEFNNILSYANEELNYASEGSGRKVYILSEKEVLKIAYTNTGIAQNKKEVEISEKESNNPLLAKVLDWDRDGYKWIISERVTPINPNSDAFSEATGIPEDLFVEGLKEVEKDSQINTGEKLIDAYMKSLRTEIDSFIKREHEIRSNPSSGLDANMLAQARSTREDILEQYESIDLNSEVYQKVVAFLTNVIKLIRQHNLLIGDVARIEHWGKSLNDDNELKLYDYGAELGSA